MPGAGDPASIMSVTKTQFVRLRFSHVPGVQSFPGESEIKREVLFEVVLFYYAMEPRGGDGSEK